MVLNAGSHLILNGFFNQKKYLNRIIPNYFWKKYFRRAICELDKKWMTRWFKFLITWASLRQVLHMSIQPADIWFTYYKISAFFQSTSNTNTVFLGSSDSRTFYYKLYWKLWWRSCLFIGLNFSMQLVMLIWKIKLLRFFEMLVKHPIMQFLES